MRRFRSLVLTVVLAFGASFAGAHVMAQSGPILLENGTTQADVPSPLVAMPDGTEIMVEPEKGPVQGIISQRNEVIEAGEVRVYVGGFVAFQGNDGWVGVEQPFYFDATGTDFADAQVTDGWRIVIDSTEG